MSAPDVQTHYLGLQLRNPFVVGASPLADTVDGARLLEDMGAAAVVVRSLFSEQVTSHLRESGLALGLLVRSISECRLREQENTRC